jgi:hypothetical protein
MKEAPVNFLTDPQEGRFSLRPADVLVYGWVGEKHACVDLSGVSLLVGLGVGDFTIGPATLKGASSKMVKLEKAKNLGFAIQKDLAAQLIVRLPCVQV